MPLQTEDVLSILNNKGMIKFVNKLEGRGDLISSGIVDAVVTNNYAKYKMVATTADNTITFTRVANDATDNNAIDVQTIDDNATVGTIGTPGYIYTGNFSGCVFYLYKAGPKKVTGVHAYSGTKGVKVKRFLRKTKINMVVREFGPTDYYLRNPATQICRYPTRLEMDVSTGENSLSFLACVEDTTVTTFLFTVKTGVDGARVVRVLRTYNADIP